MEKKEGFDFLNDHSRNFLEMAYRTDRQEVFDNHPHAGKNIGDCGDMVEIYLDVDENNIIKNITFSMNGCIYTNACANSICFLAEGKNIHEAWNITPQTVIDFLETMPRVNHHCAELAAGAFYKALNTIKTEDKEN